MTDGVIERLGLERHPEGGWFRQTWASGHAVEITPGAIRAAATLIYFYLPPGEYSAWHRVTHDEFWMWHGPGRLTLELGGNGQAPAGEVETHLLGPDLVDAEHPQLLVPGRVWQRTLPGVEAVLVSCLVSPGFDYADFELVADRTGPRPN